MDFLCSIIHICDIVVHHKLFGYAGIEPQMIVVVVSEQTWDQSLDLLWVLTKMNRKLLFHCCVKMYNCEVLVWTFEFDRIFHLIIKFIQKIILTCSPCFFSFLFFDTL